jgi:endonuclease/exonuclease/phosphatase family metal-dependent hydrolase
MDNESAYTFAVASYNVHQWIGMDGSLNLERVIQVIQELDAQIIGLQETNFPCDECEGISALQLAEKLGMSVVNGPTLTRKKGYFGNILLTKFRILSQSNFDISVSGREPRGVLDVTLEIEHRPVRVIVTHLGLHPFERRLQISEILRRISDRGFDLTLVMGDFNFWVPISLSVAKMWRKFGYCPTPCTYPSKIPVIPLDRIWVSPRSALKMVAAHKTPLSRIASDHLPLKALIQLNGKHG